VVRRSSIENLAADPSVYAIWEADQLSPTEGQESGIRRVRGRERRSWLGCCLADVSNGTTRSHNLLSVLQSSGAAHRAAQQSGQRRRPSERLINCTGETGDSRRGDTPEKRPIAILRLSALISAYCHALIPPLPSALLPFVQTRTESQMKAASEIGSRWLGNGGGHHSGESINCVCLARHCLPGRKRAPSASASSSAASSAASAVCRGPTPAAAATRAYSHRPSHLLACVPLASPPFEWSISVLGYISHHPRT
jgi:hypothetical protein